LYNSSLTDWELSISKTSLSEGNYTYFSTATDTNSNSNTTETRSLTVALPSVNLTLVSPTGNYNVTEYEFFNVVFNLSCSGADCGEINVSLDPINDIILNGYFETGDFTSWTNDNGVITSDDAHTGTYSLDVQRYIADYTTITQDFSATSEGTQLCAWVKGDVEGGDTDNIQLSIKNAGGYTLLHSYTGDSYADWTQTCYDITGQQPVTGIKIYGWNDIADVSTMLIDDICIADAEGVCVGGSSSKSGLVNTTVGATPFYTTSSNPQNISLNTGESQLVTFAVNASGGNSTTVHDFFGFANVTSNMAINDLSEHVNITIVENTQDLTPPYVAFVNPLNENYSQINYLIVNITNSSDAVYTWWNNGTTNLTYSTPVTLSNLGVEVILLLLMQMIV